MRLNQFIATHSGLSRRAADEAIANGRVTVAGQPAKLGQQLGGSEAVELDQRRLRPQAYRYLLLHKPVGVITSRRKQAPSRTIYDLLPAHYHNLKPVGRLDKDSSGVLILTNDGTLANRLTHPSFGKTKLYRVTLDKPLSQPHAEHLQTGVRLEDGPSRLHITKHQGRSLELELAEGRNRQIRRSLAALGYNVVRLERLRFGRITLGQLGPGQYQEIAKKELT